MKPGLEGIGVIGLTPGAPLRLQDAAGRHLSVVDGTVWVTQQGDPRDPVLAAGETFRFDRNGLALVTPLSGPAQVVLEGKADASPARGFARAASARLACALARALRTRRTVRELQSLSDYMLRDVGLRRDQIECVARRLAC
jgi:uncharacterized protein YjiS (DUF1127 family)